MALCVTCDMQYVMWVQGDASRVDSVSELRRRLQVKCDVQRVTRDV